MAVDYNILRSDGPTNLYAGFAAGQQAADQNALAQQKLAQERDLMTMRRQEFQANLEASQADRRRKAQVEKTAMFRDRLLRAPTPQAARELVQMQHSDPDLGPLLRQFGSLDQDLADIPDDPTKFEGWRAREAMGAAEWIKSQAAERSFQDVLQRATGAGAAPAAPAAAPVNAMAEPAAAPVNAMAARPAAAGRSPEQIRAEINALSMSSDPRAARMVQALTKEYEAALRGDQNRPMAVSPGQVVIDPRTGQQIFTAPAAPTALSDRYVPVGRLVFDRQTQQYISPTQAQLAQTQERAAGEGGVRAKPPVGYRYTATGDLEPIPGGPASPGLPPKEMQKREAAFPQAQSAMKGFESKSQSFIADLMALRDHPGLSEITGFAAGRLPGITAQGRAAQALYDKVVAKGGFQALQDMRDASKTGGALGNVSNQEGKQLIASFEAIDRRQDAKDVQAAIDNAISSIQGSQVRMREAFDETYGYRAAREAGAGAGGRQLTPQDREALNWANSNPNDPRAARIKQQLGVK